MRSEINPVQSIAFHSIGTINTPFPEAFGTPIQGVYAQGSEGRVILEESFAPALDDIEGFERLWLIYWMDRVGPYKSRVIPYRDTKEHGLFATRSPSRPNAVGISVVRFLRREGCVLYVADVDMLDNTPLLDIKPYVPEFDAHPQSRAGWYETAGIDRRQADNRFHDSSARQSIEE
jgi:tRNA (adenine37-N6)-methyltransferase